MFTMLMGGGGVGGPLLSYISSRLVYGPLPPQRKPDLFCEKLSKLFPCGTFKNIFLVLAWRDPSREIFQLYFFSTWIVSNMISKSRRSLNFTPILPHQRISPRQGTHRWNNSEGGGGHIQNRIYLGEFQSHVEQGFTVFIYLATGGFFYEKKPLVNSLMTLTL